MKRVFAVLMVALIVVSAFSALSRGASSQTGLEVLYARYTSGIKLAENILSVYVGAHPDDIDIGISGCLYKYDAGKHPILWIVVTDGGANEGEYEKETGWGWYSMDGQYNVTWPMPNNESTIRSFYSFNLVKGRCGGYFNGTTWTDEPASHDSIFGIERDWRSRVSTVFGSDVERIQLGYLDPGNASRRLMYPDGGYLSEGSGRPYVQSIAKEIASAINHTVVARGYSRDLLFVNSHAPYNVSYDVGFEHGDHSATGDAVEEAIQYLHLDYGFGQISARYYKVTGELVPRNGYRRIDENTLQFKNEKSDLCKVCWETCAITDNSSEGVNYCWPNYPNDPGDQEPTIQVDYYARATAGPTKSIISSYQKAAENNVEVNSTSFQTLQDVSVFFVTTKTANLQIVFSATIAMSTGNTMDVEPVVDGIPEQSLGPFGFAANAPDFDSRSAQWLVLGLSIGYHTATMHVRVTNGTGIMGHRSMTLNVIDPAVSPADCFGVADENNNAINNTSFEPVPGMSISFQNLATESVQVIFSATVLMEANKTMDVRPSVDGDLYVAEGPFSFAADVLNFDSRTAQWIVENLSPGTHNITMNARVTGDGNGVIGFRSMTVLLVDPNEIPASWYGVSVLDNVDFNNTSFQDVPDTSISFNTTESTTLHIVFSATVIMSRGNTTDVDAVVDNGESLALGPFGFAADAPNFDSRTAQWIVLNLAPGSHTVKIHARVTGGSAMIGYRSLTLHLLRTQHDVAVASASLLRTVIGIGYSLNMSVTAANPGDYPETFNVTAYYGNDTFTPEQWNEFWSMGDCDRDGYINEVDAEMLADNFNRNGPNPCDLNSDGLVDIFDAIILASGFGKQIWKVFLPVIDAQTIVDLAAGDSVALMFTWNTTGIAYGNFTVTAVAKPVANETNTADNNCTCDIPIHVGVPGDISGSTQGVYDGTVNMRDVAYMVALFNTKPGSPNWNPNADVNNDGTVNMRDITIGILNFNKHE